MLHRLLRIYRYQVDSLLKVIEQLEQEHYVVRQRIYSLDRRKDQEVNNYQHSAYIFLLPSFLEAYKQERVRHISTLQFLEQNLTEQRQQLDQQYAETKKVEILLEQRALQTAQYYSQQQYKLQDDMHILRADLSNY